MNSGLAWHTQKIPGYIVKPCLKQKLLQANENDRISRRAPSYRQDSPKQILYSGKYSH